MNPLLRTRSDRDLPRQEHGSLLDGVFNPDCGAPHAPAAASHGHLASSRRAFMNSPGESCEDLMTQLAAVRAATTQTIVKLFEGHMETCVRPCVQTGKGQDALDG